MSAYRGDGAGFLGDAFTPLSLHQDAPPVDGAQAAESVPRLLPFERQPVALRDAYGDNDTGRSFLAARQLIEDGVRFVTVNMMDRLTGTVSWDAHAEKHHAPTTLFDYRDTICPQFDQACAALLDDLQQRGLLSETLVVCAGEFGRSPQLNEAGGRDHWTNVWSAIAAGCGLPGGQVLGASDAHAAEPIDRPIALAEIAATIYEALRIDRQVVDTESWPIAGLCDHAPIAELVG